MKSFFLALLVHPQQHVMMFLLCTRQLSSLNCIVGICKGLCGAGQLKLPEDVFAISPFFLSSLPGPLLNLAIVWAYRGHVLIKIVLG